jgi:hypothetical protein
MVRRGKMSGKGFYLVLFALLLGLSGCSIGQPVVDKGATPTIGATAINSSPEQCATGNATRFYQDIAHHQLKQAYRYIDGRGKTEEGKQLTYATFAQEVQMGGTSQGAFSIDVGGYQPEIEEVTMTITNHQFRYHSHLQFQQEGNTCKIIMLDRI